MDEVKKELSEHVRRIPQKLIAVIVAVLIIIIVIFSVFLSWYIKGYKKAQAKAEQTISELSLALEEYESKVAIYEKASEEVSFAVLEEDIQKVGKLVTAEYLYTDVGKYSDYKQLFGKDVALTEKSFLIKWDGIISAGVDLSQFSISANEEERIITVYMPKADIISHDPDNDSYETLDEKSGLFNPIKVDDVRKFDLESETAMVQRAIDNSLLEQAQQNAETVVKQMLWEIPGVRENYSIEVEIIKN